MKKPDILFNMKTQFDWIHVSKLLLKYMEIQCC